MGIKTPYPRATRRVVIIDSHTEGEPTRVVMAGGPALSVASASAQVDRLRREHDGLRAALVDGVRGTEAAVGVLPLVPQRADAAAQLVFFNNAGYLLMCVHATIGVARTLHHAGRLPLGRHLFETPAGVVAATIEVGAHVSVENVSSYRLRRALQLRTAAHGEVTLDVAYGGNWFAICEGHGLALELEHEAALLAFAWDVRRSLARAGITGDDGHEIDHVQLVGPPRRPEADARNFVLCPGGVYDRSPCGTGTSALLACLADAGRLAPGERWRQESVTGTMFEARYEPVVGEEARGDGITVRPTIRGRAFITLEGALLLDPADDTLPPGAPW